MEPAYIVAAARTAGERRKGALAGTHPADLGAVVFNALLDHCGLDPAAIHDVIMGCVTHPLGAGGTRIMTTLIQALRARGERYGLQTMCEGGGIANVTIVEAL